MILKTSIIFISLYVLCSCKRCKVDYLPESEIKEQKKPYLIQDSVIKLKCISNYGESSLITIYFEFTTKRVYNIDSLDIQLKADNDSILNPFSFDYLCENISGMANQDGL